MTGHAGIDTMYAPSPAAMAEIMDATNVGWCCAYLWPAPSHARGDWMAAGYLEQLAKQGWGFAFDFLGQELSGPGSHLVNGPQGHTDGASCAAIMRALVQRGVAAEGAYAFLDLEVPDAFDGPYADYVIGWATAMEQAGFGVGVYCSHAMAAAVVAGIEAVGLSTPRIWAFHVETTAYGPYPGTTMRNDDPAGSGFAAAHVWQCVAAATLTNFAGLEVDLDTALTTNPSAP